MTATNRLGHRLLARGWHGGAVQAWLSGGVRLTAPGLSGRGRLAVLPAFRAPGLPDPVASRGAARQPSAPTSAAASHCRARPGVRCPCPGVRAQVWAWSDERVSWTDRVPVVMEYLGDRGLVCLVKMDGERQHKRWTVVITGKEIAEHPVRVDGNSLDYCFDSALKVLCRLMPGLDDLV